MSLYLILAAVPVEVLMRRPTFFQISPKSFHSIQFYVEEPSHIKFNFSVGPTAQLAIYGRKGLKPTHTKVVYRNLFR